MVKRRMFGGRRTAGACSGGGRLHRRSWEVIVGGTLLVIPVLVLGLWVGRGRLEQREAAHAKAPGSLRALSSLEALLAVPPSAIAGYDIGLVNLLCAEGLPGAESLDRAECLANLDRWAGRVAAETERHVYRFRANPAEFDRSEAYFRMLMMAVVLCEDFGIRYNPQRMTVPGAAGADDGFFADSRDLFLHGLLGGRRMGTCSSMPVLYAAIGRRLGYPLKLATTKAHVFLRWDGPTERLNLEATGRGMNHYGDEHYKRWPFAVTEEEVVAEGYLKSLTRAQELALFLSLRGNCLRACGRLTEAVAAYKGAAAVAPEARAYRAILAEAQAVAAAPVAGVVASPALPPNWAGTGGQAGRPADPNPLRNIR